MLVLDINSNIDEVEQGATDFFRNQVPFATSLMLNASIKDVRRFIVGVTYPKAFQVRNAAFPGTMFRMNFSTKRNLEVELFDRLERDYMELHTTGGVKRPHSGRNLAIPINITRTGTGRIPKSKKPRSLTAKKSTRIIRGKSGKNLIVEKYKGQTIVRYVLSPTARISKSFRYYEDAEQVFLRVAPGHWDVAIARALRTSKAGRIFSVD